MHTAILLCAVLFSSDPSASVQAKIVYGTAAEQQHRADMNFPKTSGHQSNPCHD